MKKAFKSAFYSVFRVFSKLPTTRFSDFFISLGYFIKSEGVYNNNKAKTLTWDRLDLHKSLSTIDVKPDEKIVYLEFGVFWGETFFIWVSNNKNPNSKFVGFDTFSGLPEDWGSIKKGSFSAKGKVPNIADSRVEFCVGLIQDTLPDYTKKLTKGQRKVVHIDVDLYNATLITLIHLQPFFEKGDIIIFDDFYTVTKADHEFRGFLDFLTLYKVNYKPLVNVRNGHYVIEIQ